MEWAVRALAMFPWLWTCDGWTDEQSSATAIPYPAHPSGLPGGGGQCDKQGLEDAADEYNGVLSGNEEVKQGQDEEAVDHQPTHHGDGIEAKLLSDGCGVVHLQDLASDEEHDAEGEVPGGRVWTGSQLRARQVGVPGSLDTAWLPGPGPPEPPRAPVRTE